MHFLLIVALFTLNSDGSYGKTAIVTHPYNTYTECYTAAHKDLHKEADIPNDVHILTYCVQPSDYEE